MLMDHGDFIRLECDTVDILFINSWDCSTCIFICVLFDHYEMGKINTWSR